LRLESDNLPILQQSFFVYNGKKASLPLRIKFDKYQRRSAPSFLGEPHNSNLLKR
jgi:hypothetical protein